MRESNVQALVRLALSKLGFTAFRNNTGVAWQGDAKRIGPSRVLLENARPVHFGLTRGSSDVIGFKSITITPDHLNRTVAIFAAIEVKAAKGKTTEEQNNFLDCVRNAGGIGIVARNPDDIERGLSEWMSKK